MVEKQKRKTAQVLVSSGLPIEEEAQYRASLKKEDRMFVRNSDYRYLETLRNNVLTALSAGLFEVAREKEVFAKAYEEGLDMVWDRIEV